MHTSLKEANLKATPASCTYMHNCYILRLSSVKIFAKNIVNNLTLCKEERIYKEGHVYEEGRTFWGGNNGVIDRFAAKTTHISHFNSVTGFPNCSWQHQCISQLSC